MWKQQKPLQQILAFSILLIMSCSSGQDGTTENDNNRDSGTQETSIPADVKYTIINEDTVPGMKRGLDVRLNQKVGEDVLESIALKLKASASENYKRTFIGYYLPGMEVNAGYWATTHFNPNLEVRILGVTVEQENAQSKKPADPSREVVGTWIQEGQPFPGRITIFQQDGAMYMEKIFRDGNDTKYEMVEKPSTEGRKLMKANKTGSGDDYYLIDNQGNLQLWSQDLDGSHVLVVTARKIAD